MSTIGRLGRHTKENYLQLVGKREPVQEGTKEHRLPSEEPQTVVLEYIIFIQILITNGNKLRLSSSMLFHVSISLQHECNLK